MRTDTAEKLNYFVFGCVLFIIYAYLLAPVIIIVLVSFNPTDSLVIPTSHFSLKWYYEFFKISGFVKALRFSLQLALVASILTPIVGIPSAYAVVRFNFRYKNAVETFLLSPILIPSIIIGMSMLHFFVSLKLRGTFLSILICHVILTTPYIMRTVIASLSGVDVAIEEAAEILGASRFQIFTKITLPLMASGVIAGLLFVFVTSFGELDASIFVTGPKTVTLPIQLFSYLQWSSSPVIASISAIQIIFVFVAALIIDRVLGLGKTMQLG